MAHAGEVTVKVTPDLSEFAAALTQHLELDDPLAKAIVAAAHQADVRIDARVGETSFSLHHWTITKVNGKSQLQTSWIRTDTYLIKQEDHTNA